jgi:ComF family protein
VRTAAAATVSLAGRHLFEPLLAALFPSCCPLCDVLLASPTRGPLCERCLGSLPRHRVGVCGCGQPLPLAVPPPCGRCRRQINPLPEGANLGPYEGSLRGAVLALKFGGRRRLATQLARALWTEPRVRTLLADEAILVPVPLHGRRLRQRGFNQSELIARELARLSRQPLRAQALRRRRDTSAQTGLTAAQRRANVAGAFEVRRRDAVLGRTVVLVDDVYTTGATARACARALRQAGARSVRLLTVARTA